MLFDHPQMLTHTTGEVVSDIGVFSWTVLCYSSSRNLGTHSKEVVDNSNKVCMPKPTFELQVQFERLLPMMSAGLNILVIPFKSQSAP